MLLIIAYQHLTHTGKLSHQHTLKLINIEKRDGLKCIWQITTRAHYPYSVLSFAGMRGFHWARARLLALLVINISLCYRALHGLPFYKSNPGKSPHRLAHQWCNSTSLCKISCRSSTWFGKCSMLFLILPRCLGLQNVFLLFIFRTTFSQLCFHFKT